MSIPITFADKVDLRKVWPREQQDFSRWLVENIHFLNEHLPFEVDADSLIAEAPAGPFSVDVVGDAISSDSGETFKVVIENQLEQTDHRHLGQIMTYLAAYDAKAAIWISAGARPEHARAVQWLNDESNIDAWLFDVEVIRIGDSPAAPILRRIIGPSALSVRAKQERRETEAVKRLRRDFWQVVLPIVQEATRDLGVFTNRTPSGNVYVSQKADGPADAYWQVWATSSRTWLCLRFHGNDKAEVMHYFNQLRDRQVDIEEAFGASLRWDPLEGSTGAVVRWDNPVEGGFQSDPETWRPAGERLAEGMRRLIEALGKSVSELSPYTAREAVEQEGGSG